MFLKQLSTPSVCLSTQRLDIPPTHVISHHDSALDVLGSKNMTMFKFVLMIYLVQYDSIQYSFCIRFISTQGQIIIETHID